MTWTDLTDYPRRQLSDTREPRLLTCDIGPFRLRIYRDGRAWFYDLTGVFSRITLSAGDPEAAKTEALLRFRQVLGEAGKAIDTGCPYPGDHG